MNSLQFRIGGVLVTVAILLVGAVVLEPIFCYPERGVDANGQEYVMPRGVLPEYHDFVNEHVWAHSHPWLETRPAPVAKTLPESTSSTEELLKRADRLIADRVDPVVNVRK